MKRVKTMKELTKNFGKSDKKGSSKEEFEKNLESILSKEDSAKNKKQKS